MGAIPGLARADILQTLEAVADDVPVDLRRFESAWTSPDDRAGLDTLTALVGICAAFRHRTIPRRSSLHPSKDRHDWPDSRPLAVPPRTSSRSGRGGGQDRQSVDVDVAGPVGTGYDGAAFFTSVPSDEPPDPTPPSNGLLNGPLEMQSTVDLLALAKNGNSDAVEVIFARCVPVLRRWARGRLPYRSRTLLETQDIVQDAVYQVLRRLDKFEARHQGALQAYLRQAVLNRIRDEARLLARRPAAVEFDDQHPDSAASPLEQAIDHDDLERYEAALARLRPIDREAIIARIELQNSYEEIAQALGKPTANAARSLVVRALYKLYEEMGHGA